MGVFLIEGIQKGLELGDTGGWYALCRCDEELAGLGSQCQWDIVSRGWGAS